MSNRRIFVKQSSHANWDSLPLRFGLHFDSDVEVMIVGCTDLGTDKSYADRHHFDGSIQDPRVAEGPLHRGHFVVGKPTHTGALTLITVWRNDADTELFLSETLKNLRQDGVLSPDLLLQMHPLYLQGKLRTSADLIRFLSEQVASADLELLRDSVRKAAHEIEEVKVRLLARDEEIRKLKAREEQRLHLEQKSARDEGQAATLSDADVLVHVAEQVIHRGSSCTVITLGDGAKRYLKTATFDPLGHVTRSAFELLGKRVRTTCWDPLNSPGKWSSQGYFRNIYEQG